MRKSVFATVLAGVLTFVVLGTGCQIHNSFDSLVPDEYGGWENHYIYHGNVRSKTTGDDGEYLVKSVTADGKTYTVQSCIDSDSLGDDLYLCLTLSDPESNGLVTKYALVCYNVKDKTQETVMMDYSYQDEEGVTYEYHPYTVERIYDTAEIILQGQRVRTAIDENGEERYGYASAYFKINRNLTAFQEIDFAWNGYTRVSEDYFTATIADTDTQTASVYYGAWDMTEPILVATVDNSGATRTETKFVEKDEAKGFLLTTYTSKENAFGTQEDCLQKISFYNLDTGELTTIFEGNDFVDWVKVPNSEYFLTYTYDTVTYTQKSSLFESAQTYTATMKQDCVLYQIVYSANGVEVKTAYDFDDGVSVNNMQGIDKDGCLYASVERYENAGLLNKGGYKSQRSKIHLSDGKMTKLDSEEWSESSALCYGSYALNNMPTYDGYAYYVESVALTTVYENTTYAYRLQRYNSKNKETDVMQLWKGSGSQEGEKFCEMMWRNNGGAYSEFVVRNY